MPGAQVTPVTAHPRLALNQWTTRRWSLAEAIDGCVRHGVRGLGVWREKVAEIGIAEARRRIDDAGLAVTSLCRGGFFTAAGNAALAENRRAVDEAAALGAPLLVLVAGGLPAGSRDVTAARGRAQEVIAELVPYAASAGVRLALEPLHPMYCADRCVLSTLAQALEWAAPFDPSAVGVCVDTFHIWWDPTVLASIAAVAAAGRLATYQVCDFMLPIPADALLARGMMGDGVIDFAPMTAAVAASGYTGPVEVEIFNADVWAEDPDSVMTRMVSSFAEFVAPSL
jgi:sugar phosphate isomerase/epimerase